MGVVRGVYCGVAGTHRGVVRQVPLQASTATETATGHRVELRGQATSAHVTTVTTELQQPRRHDTGRPRQPRHAETADVTPPQ